MSSSSSPPPPSTFRSSVTSFPIVLIAVLGIFATAALLLAYYIFVVKCCVNLRAAGDLRRRRLSRSRRQQLFPGPLTSFSSPSAAKSQGLDPAAIAAIPTFRYSPTAAESGGNECAVCLAEFHNDELLRRLPFCKHSFHVDCVDTWLQSSSGCPVCRTEIKLPFPATSAAKGDSFIIDVRNEPPAMPAPTPKKQGRKKLSHALSFREDSEEARDKDELFAVQPIRRSLSMDSSGNRQLYLSVQDYLRRNPELIVRGFAGNGEGSSNPSGGCAFGKFRRSIFSFGHRRSSSGAVTPVIDPNLIV
ncbi:RING-H2 finger protein ATL16 [Apostasia shenzhenica]|uniref:RING-type E3 ubiquitin transferase n=1 Tax=Apostasia shenzhenica TaxID=1088818 RepID=A0A2I0ALR5_9ASPA|nr:RING-H2 finger protein ATL16 [Apostasia shenzhenica]